jgi:hypothetical protein
MGTTVNRTCGRPSGLIYSVVFGEYYNKDGQCSSRSTDYSIRWYIRTTTMRIILIIYIIYLVKRSIVSIKRKAVECS